MSQQDNLEVIEIHKKRLLELQKRAALYGAIVDPSVTIEINQIKTKLERLGVKLDDTPTTASSLSPQNSSPKVGEQVQSKKSASCFSSPVLVISLLCILGLCVVIGIFGFSSWFSEISKSVARSQDNQLPSTTSAIQSKSTPSSSPVHISTPTVNPTPTIDISLLFVDDFSEGLKPEWQKDHGEWKMVNGRLVSVGYVDDSARIFVGDPEWHNYTISLETGTFTSNFIKGNAVAVLARVQDNSNYVWFFVNYSYVICAIKQDGNDTILSEKRDTSFNPIGKGDHRFLVKVESTRYEFILDDKQVCFFEDDTFSKGKVGLWAKPDMNYNNPWIDNFKVTELP